MFCGYCGTEFTEGIFCPECGKRYINEAELTEKTKEVERLYKEKHSIDCRTVNGKVYRTEEEAELAAEEHNKIEILKTKLLQTKSQKERQRIFYEFSGELHTIEAKQRYELLKIKVETKQPISEKILFWYGISVLITVLIYMILSMTGNEESVFWMITLAWSGFGVWIWPIWKVVSVFKGKKDSHYKNLKNI